MGALFALEHANIVSYITSKNRELPPPFARQDLENFLMAFAWSYDGSLFSSQEYSEWPEKIGGIAGHALDFLYSQRRDENETSFVDPVRSKEILDPLKMEFSSFETYFLYLSSDYQEIDRIFLNL
ncbi:MAG: hypothetical protein IPI64_02370 [Chloracidobacterium sp.]|nr:hypothetical protein [Chloracidobacterium sp.]